MIYVLDIQVVTDLDGNFIVQIGSTGEEGLRDGNFDEVTFNRPQVRFSLEFIITVMLLKKNNRIHNHSIGLIALCLPILVNLVS